MKDWTITEKKVDKDVKNRYWACGSAVTVVEIPSTEGPRFTCLTDQSRTCEHADAVRKYLDAPYV